MGIPKNLLCALLLIITIFLIVNFLLFGGNKKCDENSENKENSITAVNNISCEECNYESIALKTELLDYYINLAFSSEDQISDITEYATQMNELVEKIGDEELLKEFDNSVMGENEEERIERMVNFLKYLSKSIQMDLKK